MKLIDILLEKVDPKEKSRLIQMFNKALEDPNFDDEDLNKIKSAITDKKLAGIGSDRRKQTKDTLNQYADEAKFNLPRTVQKYIEASKANPEYKFQFEKLFRNPENLITSQKLRAKTSGNLMDLVSSSFRKNPVFKDVSDYLLSFRARQKGVGESWLLTFGKNPDPKGEGDVKVDGIKIEVKDGSGEFSVDTKLNNKYIQDELNDKFFAALNSAHGDLDKLGKQRTKDAKLTLQTRKKIQKLQNYLNKGGRKPVKSTLPSAQDLLKYSNIDPAVLDTIREARKGKPGPGLNYVNPQIWKFLIQQKKSNPDLLKSELREYYSKLYQGAAFSTDELADQIYDNIGKSSDKIVFALSTFLLKQYFAKEGFDMLMVVDPVNLKYSILDKEYVGSLKYGDDLPGELSYRPKYSRQGDAQNLSDGWVNMGFKK